MRLLTHQVEADRSRTLSFAVDDILICRIEGISAADIVFMFLAVLQAGTHKTFDVFRWPHLRIYRPHKPQGQQQHCQRQL